jgi:hypothetical protein
VNAVRPWLYVGKYMETADLGLLTRAGIGGMLQLAGPVRQPGIASLYVPVVDGVALPNDALRRGVDFVLAEKRREARVLIACGAGISRAVTFAVAALKEEENLGLLDALLAVKGARPEALPHPVLWESLCRYYREDVPIRSMLGALGFGG